MRDQEKEISFLDHLEIFRWHLIRSAVAILFFAVIAFIFKEINQCNEIASQIVNKIGDLRKKHKEQTNILEQLQIYLIFSQQNFLRKTK